MDHYETLGVPKGASDDLVIVCGVFIHWEAKDKVKIYDYNYEATKLAIQRAMKGEPKIEEITAKRNTVTVRLLQPNSSWQFTPAASPGLVYSQADYLKKGANFGTPNGMPIGSGPYMFSEFSPNSRVVLTRNPYYKGKRYPWDKIVFNLIQGGLMSRTDEDTREDFRGIYDFDVALVQGYRIQLDEAREA